MQKNIWQMLKWLKDKTTKKDKNNEKNIHYSSYV